MTKKKKQLTFIDPIYGFTFHIFFKKDLAYLNKFTGEPERNCTARAYMIADPDGKYKDLYNLFGIYFSNSFFEKTTKEQTSILCHECWHLTEFTLGSVGVNIEFGGVNEHIAYYLQFLYENYYSLLYDQP